MSTIRTKLIAAGVRNLQSFGYPQCSPENILTDQIYSMFFRSALNENKGKGFDKDIDALLAELPKETA